jgi:hypothetical protein
VLTSPVRGANQFGQDRSDTTHHSKPRPLQPGDGSATALTMPSAARSRAVSRLSPPGANSHSSPVGSFHSYGSLQVTSLIRSLPTIVQDLVIATSSSSEGVNWFVRSAHNGRWAAATHAVGLPQAPSAVDTRFTSTTLASCRPSRQP